MRAKKMCIRDSYYWLQKTLGADGSSLTNDGTPLGFQRTFSPNDYNAFEYSDTLWYTARFANLGKADLGSDDAVRANSCLLYTSEPHLSQQ